MHSFQLSDDATRSITAAALAAPVDDVTIKLFDPANNLLGSYDVGTSPEVATYTAASIPAGIYKAQVCPFDAASVVIGPYALLVSTSDTAAPDPGDLTLNPKWRYFTANPDLPSTAVGTPVTNSVIGCWRAGTGCTTPNGPLGNIADSGPWDVVAGVSTMTTIGNNANTHEAWANPLAPGGTAQAPVSPTREYTEDFTDAWNESGCDPSELVPGGNDINASVGNLFVTHNRMHDYSYYLGFTEDNYNMQLDNRGHGGAAGDAEVGNAQAGAITGGAPSELGRDNANQITLNDGVPGITNQYLFQPLPGAFYAPCTDGGLDTSIVGHEYTHAISNRMIGGPDDGITSEQGGAMGESWGDLNAAEYMFENDYSTGTSPWAVGPYATGNTRVGIRDYAIDQNPLNYSDYGFDSTGVEVHADGEIWNGTMWEVRQALVEKWNAQFPYNDKALQKQCVTATETSTPLPASACPGNRRWIQLVFDAFLLQQGATSMLDARDAMIAADQMRFGGANKDALWGAFARRGMGAAASTPDADSGDPTPDFSTPSGPNQVVTFQSYGEGEVYVGDYEARATPIADTIAASPLGASAKFTPGTYKMLYVSPDRGFQRFTLTVPATSAPQYLTIDDNGVNTSSRAAGGSVVGATAGSLNADLLIDGTEATNWGGVTADNVDVSTPSVAVALAGGTQTVRRVNVSSMLSPAADGAVDADSGSRFTALRKFALEACTASCGSPGATWTRFYTSPDDAFPSEAPRPVAPTLTMRAFDVPDTSAAAVRLVALQNQCTGNPAYAGELDNDPLNPTDCKTGSDRGTIVHAAELQVFNTAAPAAPVSSPSPGLPGLAAPHGLTKKTKTRVKLTHNRQVRGAQQADLKIKVISSRKVIKAAGAKLGKVVIYDNGHKVRSFKLKKKGKKTWAVPANLSVGKHKLRVVFKPADPTLFKSSRSRKVTLIVLPG
jgi:extracellular elastinolytic metalloproteinase